MAKNTASSAASSTARAPRAKKVKAPAAAPMVLQHAESLDMTTEIDPIDALLAELDGDVIEASAVAADIGTVSNDELLAALDDEPVATADADLERAVSGAEAVEAMIATATPEGVDDGAMPTGDVSDAPEAVATVGGETAPKKERAPRKHYTDKVGRLKDRMGASLSEYTVLTLDDAGVDEEQLRMRMEETLAIIKGMNKKKQVRAGFLIEFLSGKKAKLNEVMERILTVLQKDGVITSGKEGNVLKNLLARPYSEGAARAMGDNSIGVFKDFKMLLEDGKGRLIANPESVLLMKVNSMLFAAPAAAEDSVAA